MKSIINKIEQREKEREKVAWQQQLQHFSNRNSNIKPTGQNRARVENLDLTPNLFTPAMEEVIRKRSHRVSVEFDVPITPGPSDSEEEYAYDDSDNEEVILPQNIRDQVTRRRLLGDFDELNDKEHKLDTIPNNYKVPHEQESDSENDEETESYVNSSDEEDIFPVKDEISTVKPVNYLNTEKSSRVTSRKIRRLIPMVVQKFKRKKVKNNQCNNVQSSPFRGWKTPSKKKVVRLYSILLINGMYTLYPRIKERKNIFLPAVKIIKNIPSID